MRVCGRSRDWDAAAAVVGAGKGRRRGKEERPRATWKHIFTLLHYRLLWHDHRIGTWCHGNCQLGSKVSKVSKGEGKMTGWMDRSKRISQGETVMLRKSLSCIFCDLSGSFLPGIRVCLRCVWVWVCVLWGWGSVSVVLCVLRWYSPNRSPNYPALGKSYYSFTRLLDFAPLTGRDCRTMKTWDICSWLITGVRKGALFVAEGFVFVQYLCQICVWEHSVRMWQSVLSELRAQYEANTKQIPKQQSWVWSGFTLIDSDSTELQVNGQKKGGETVSTALQSETWIFRLSLWMWHAGIGEWLTNSWHFNAALLLHLPSFFCPTNAKRKMMYHIIHEKIKHSRRKYKIRHGADYSAHLAHTCTSVCECVQGCVCCVLGQGGGLQQQERGHMAAWVFPLRPEPPKQPAT